MSLTGPDPRLLEAHPELLTAVDRLAAGDAAGADEVVRGLLAHLAGDPIASQQQVDQLDDELLLFLIWLYNECGGLSFRRRPLIVADVSIDARGLSTETADSGWTWLARRLHQV